MDAEKVRINITLPVTVAKELNQLTAPRKRSQFIAEAITAQIKKLKEDRLEALLKEGYEAGNHTGEEITKDFEAVDMEGWDDY